MNKTMIPIVSLTLRPMEDGDPLRCMIDAQLEIQAKPPGCGLLSASLSVAIWIDDNPTWQQIQLRVLHTLPQAFSLPDELRSQLGSDFASDQKDE